MSDYWAAVLTPVALDAICVVGLYLIASTGRISVAQAAFFGVGGYTAGLWSIHVGARWLSGLVIAMIVAAVLAFIFALIAEPLEHWFFAIATLAAGVIMQNLATNLDFLGGSLGLYNIPLTTSLSQAAFALVLVILAIGLLDASPFGRACRAIKDNPVAAAASGIDVRRVRVQAFVVGSAVAGLAGGLWGHYLGIIRPADLSFGQSLSYLVYLSVGGSESILGGLIGTSALGIAPEVLRFSASFRFVLYGILLVVVMGLRPSGAIPRISLYRFMGGIGRGAMSPRATRPGAHGLDWMASISGLRREPPVEDGLPTGEEEEHGRSKP